MSRTLSTPRITATSSAHAVPTYSNTKANNRTVSSGAYTTAVTVAG